MSNNNLETERQRGEKAKLLLDEPLFKEAFELLKTEYQTAMFQTKHNDDDVRKALWQAFHITDKVENHFRTVMETGKLATVQLNDIKKNST
jgi:hypothetical protein|tara:strand:- start:424 stop:696 length:273 start_codon:yes stop_codon:yes gene_type:complete